MTVALFRRLLAECMGTMALLVVVVGSGIMAERLSDGNIAIALLANALATGAGLYVLIEVFAPISGAHFNPVVSMAMWLTRALSLNTMLAYMGVQVLGALLGVALAHAMFDIMPLLEASTHQRSSTGQWISEVVATFGLLLTILSTVKHKPSVTAVAVAAYITAAYWFTASTSFANPAVTIARAFTDTFAGIYSADVPAFILMQAIGMLLAVLVARVLLVDKAC